MTRKLGPIGMAMLAAAGVVAGGLTAAPAQAKTVKACVNKKTGEIRIGKKCKEGWKKVTWSTKGATGPQGATGPTGAAGPNLVVKDATGKTLGQYLGLYPTPFSLMFVQVEGGAYLYLPNGQVYTFNQSPRWKESDCSGTAFIQSDSPQTTALMVGSAGGPSRVVYRKVNGGLGPVRAWKYTSTTSSINQLNYYLNQAGGCVAELAVYNGEIVNLEPVTAPSDVPGPLTVG